MGQKRLGCSWIILAFLALAPVNPSHAQSAAEFWLSASSPQASFPLAQDKIAQGETVIVVRVGQVENPAQVDFTVTLSLGRCAGDAERTEIPLGALGLYPKGSSNRRFVFELEPALKKIPHGEDPGRFCLEFRLRPLRASEQLRDTRVLISAPEWQKPPRA